VPLGARLDLLASVAATVAAAHDLGILHKDLKPGNILVQDLADGSIAPKVIDFGSADLADPHRLDALGITRTSALAEEATQGDRSGTLLWMAPELLSGGVATTASDVFALGVMLYQLVVADLRRPFAPGWEADVADPLLREDISVAAARNPHERLRTAQALADRLRSLDARRLTRDRLIEAEARALAAESRLARLRARRPWLATAVGSIALATAATSALYVGAAHDRDTARRQQHITEVVNRFLADDLIGRASPFKSAGPDETLLSAVKTASAAIDTRFAGEPAVAARLHQAIANALDKRSDWADARTQYGLAIAAWRRAEGEDSAGGVVTQLQQAMMEARSYEQGSLSRAAGLVAAAEPRVGRLSSPRPDLPVWLASARGMIALVGNDIRTAQREFAAACAVADRLSDFNPTQRLTLRQRLAFTKIRLGDGVGAEALFRGLIRDFTAIEGPAGPNVLMVSVNLAQALMVQGRHAEAIAQANATYPALRSRLGDDHEMTLQLLTTRAQSEGMLEHWDDSIRDDLLVHDAAVRKQGPRSFFAIATLSDAATAQCRSGRLAEGARNAEAARDFALAAFGKAALADATAYTLAECEIAANQPERAARNLEGIDREAVAQLAADPNWGSNVDLALARIAFAQGRKADARALLERAAPAFRLKTADPFLVRTWQALDRAT
jgi:serine/threonine protein kinase